MKVIYGIGNLNRGPKGLKVVAVGVFDGVHLGHKKILQRVVREAKSKKIISAVVTFHEHPSAFFSPESKIPAITSLHHKTALIEKEGIDLCYVIHFNKAFANLSSEDFIKRYMIDKLNMCSLYVGEDFVFGRKAAGNISLLKKISRFWHFKLNIIEHLKLRSKIVSSTLIRELICKGEFLKAKIFLGRRVSVLGKVIRGEGRGRHLGFPTANIEPEHEAIASDGIYATKAILGKRILESITYIGTRPTFAQSGQKSLLSRHIEVFIMDFNKNLYGEKMEIQFFKKIRNGKKFLSAQKLISQMRKDVIAAKKILS